jgi:hypothetical protein
VKDYTATYGRLSGGTWLFEPVANHIDPYRITGGLDPAGQPYFAWGDSSAVGGVLAR